VNTNGDSEHISQLGLAISNQLMRFIKIFNKGLVDVLWQLKSQTEE
jgi:hypothetical protein